jgi:hypothetical protein
MLGTDLIAVMIALVTSVTVMIITIKRNAELERENAWLRERVTSLRKQVATVVEKDMSV